MHNHEQQETDSTDRKVDRSLQLLEGDEDAPGLMKRVAFMETLLFGKDRASGMIHKVTVMWRIHIWVLCTASAFVGFMARELVKIIWKF